MLGITHGLFAIALSSVLMLDMPYILIGSLLPDIDFILGVEHRGLTHSLLFLILISAIVYYKAGKREGISMMLGIASHLILDSITVAGVRLFYPLQMMYSFSLTLSSSSSVNFLIIISSFVIFFNRDYLTERLKEFKSKDVQFAVYSILVLWLLTIFFFGSLDYKVSAISQLLADVSKWDGRTVSLNATICSDIKARTSGTGNSYQTFYICDSENNKLYVYKLKKIESSNLSEGQKIKINGVFTTDYLDTVGPELNLIKSVNIIE